MADQPCGLWEKRPLAGDFQHQATAASQARQRRKHHRIELVAETSKLCHRMAVEVFRFPGNETVARRQHRSGNFVLGKIEFHSESTEIPHANTWPTMSLLKAEVSAITDDSHETRQRPNRFPVRMTVPACPSESFRLTK